MRDHRGDALVQFVLVLPVLVLVVLALYAVFMAYAARSTLCTAVWEAARYLQVEGPMKAVQGMPDPYPSEWQRIAYDVINSELKSSTMSTIPLRDLNDGTVGPPRARRSNKEMYEITPENVEQDWFFVRATVYISNPLAFMIQGLGAGNTIKVTCQGTGFYESPPIGPTPGGGRGVQKPPFCPPVGICTPGPEFTPDPRTPTPTCPPCKKR